MVNYQNGKVYKIINEKNEIIYIGSTAQKLCQRYQTHNHKSPNHKIILIEKDDHQSDFSNGSLKTSMAAGKAFITSYRPDHIIIKTESSGPGYLVLSEIFYPGWKVFVDGQPKRVSRCNYLFRMIELPEGHHVVRFVFDPLSIKVGIGITIFTLFMCLIIFVYHIGNKGSMRSGSPS